MHEKKTNLFAGILNSFAKENNLPFKVFSIGSIFWFAFSERDKIKCADDIDPDSMSKFNVLYHEMLSRGIYFGPSGYEVGFISSAHTDEILNLASKQICSALQMVFAGSSSVRIS